MNPYLLHFGARFQQAFFAFIQGQELSRATFAYHIVMQLQLGIKVLYYQQSCFDLGFESIAFLFP